MPVIDFSLLCTIVAAMLIYNILQEVIDLLIWGEDDDDNDDFNEEL